MAFGGSKATPTHITLRTIEVTIKKSSKNDRIGLNGAPSKNFWSVLDVQDGLVRRWNEQHPDLAVEDGDLIVACNGMESNGEKIVEVMKNDMELNITVAKNANGANTLPGTPSTAADDYPQDEATDPNCQALDDEFERQVSTKSACISIEELEEFERQVSTKSACIDIEQLQNTGIRCEANADDGPRPKDPDQAAKGATSNMKMMEEQALPDNDIVEPERKQNGWCCFGS